jgi:ribosomal protein S18 acetylase RimI-like enzyme
VGRDIAVRELTPDDLSAAIGIVSRGMLDNPIHVCALGPDPGVRRARLGRMFALGFPILFANGVVLGAFDGATLVGVAGMVPPGRCQLPARKRLVLLPRMIPAIGFGAFVRVGRWLSAWGRQDPAEPHWHLGPVAVDAHLQGRGIGTALMSEYCALLDRDGAMGYLETDKPRNVRFYEKFGFETIGEAQILDTPTWFMRRPGGSTIGKL